jgi:hypothetical protein
MSVSASSVCQSQRSLEMSQRLLYKVMFAEVCRLLMDPSCRSKRRCTVHWTSMISYRLSYDDPLSRDFVKDVERMYDLGRELFGKIMHELVLQKCSQQYVHIVDRRQKGHLKRIHAILHCLTILMVKKMHKMDGWFAASIQDFCLLNFSF